MKYELLIKNGEVFYEGRLQKADVLVKDGLIAGLLADAKQEEAEKVIDAHGCYVLPGFIDPHVHLNDPGLTNSEDFYTGTSGAAAGGVTTVLEHPLTFPLPATLEAFAEKKAIGESKAVTNFALFGACAPDNDEEMLKILDNGAIAFKTFLPYSSEIPMLTDSQVLDKMELLSDKDIVLAVHCENDNIVTASTEKMEKAGRISFGDYPDGRPEIAELEAVARICLFAAKTGCKVNIAHCTLAEAVSYVTESRRRGADVSVETCPQYLLMDRSMMDTMGVFSICNPPLRTKEENERMWQCLFDGSVDWVCSDHSTYTVEEKMAGRDNAFKTPAGVTGIETTYQLLFSEGVVKRGLPLGRFVELASANAARRYRLYPKKGVIAIGADADLAILDPHREWTIAADKLKQMIKWSTYDGWKLTGKVVKTIVNGREVYDGENIIAAKGSGRFVAPLRR